MWSRDGLQIAYIAGGKIVPHDESPSYSGEKIVFGVPSAGGKARAIGTPGEYNGLAWIDGGLVYDRQADAYKTRVIHVADANGGRPRSQSTNPKVYANASPGSHIDQLARPLLVRHGTSEVNVPFLQSVWLMDEALKKHKG